MRGYDPSKDAISAAAKNGISGASSIAAAVDGADVVVSILPSNKVVLEAYLGKDGVVKHVRYKILFFLITFKYKYKPKTKTELY